MLPNFFIVGAPKSGTTSLYNYLDHHPEVFMSAVKEPNFFSYDDTVKQNLYYKERGIEKLSDYEKLFETVSGQKIIGEASVSYLFYESVPNKIKNLVNQPKILMLLRNPVDRAYSHYFMDYKLRYVNDSFENVVYKKTVNKNAALHFQQYIELGLYYEQVKRYVDAFGKSNVKIYLYEDLTDNINALIADLYQFLDIDQSYIPNLEKKYNSYEAPRNGIVRLLYSVGWLRRGIKSLMPEGGVNGIKKILFSRKSENKNAATVSYLKSFYKNDIQQLEKLINRNLKSWYE